MQFIKTRFISSILIFSLMLFVTSGFFAKKIDAAQMTSAKDTMSTQAISATATHTLNWTLASGATNAAGDTIAVAFNASDFAAGGTWVLADFAFTGNAGGSAAPAVVGTGSAVCTGSGATNYIVNVSSSTFTITLCTGWTTSAATFANTFVIYGTTATGTGTLTNKSSDVDSSLITITKGSDSVSLATVVEANDIVTVSATVNPTLTLNISASTIGLGTLTTASAATGSHTARIGTNAAGGFLLTYNGATLTSGTNTISAYGSQAASAPGSVAGFGINMAVNTVPAVGAGVTTTAGACASLPSDYGTANKFSYFAGTTTSLTNQLAPADCTYTISYIANITAVTPAGAYSTPVTFIASGTF